MIDREPIIRVGILEHRKEIRGVLGGHFVCNGVELPAGEFTAVVEGGEAVLRDAPGRELARGGRLQCTQRGVEPFALHGVTIGIQFHWERSEDETFSGDLTLQPGPDGMLMAINEVPVEEYLKSVISSEMSAEAPLELLKAHAITSRSWLVAMLEREHRNVGSPTRRSLEAPGEIIRWYDREDHDFFDVCADDHCQRYQGITRIVSPAVQKAVDATRGVFLAYGDEICDARFSKSCGGLSEEFQNVWENQGVPYLKSISDADVEHPPLRSEADAARWICSSPRAYCNTLDRQILRQVLPSYDQETTDYFRWRVKYSQQELAGLLHRRSGIDFGSIRALVPLERGPSGRIFRLKIEGSKLTLVVGKELEIRRWLSASHLYSSAFVVETDPGPLGVPLAFQLVGAGWGHGVGLCQIGAAVMATQSIPADRIVLHYFRGATLRTCYT